MEGERASCAGTPGDSPGDVVCLGESMALFVPAETSAPDRCAEHAEGLWRQTVGGAESNVAFHLAGAGLTSRWVGALGEDPFGDAVLDTLTRAGVDTASAYRDPLRPTGVYFKSSAEVGSRVQYYRGQSAASAMKPNLLDAVDLSDTRLLHLTGITPALSTDCRDLTRAALALSRPGRSVSFDVNWRSRLWASPEGRVDDAAELLRALADSADIVLVGDDESEAIWNRSSPAEIRELLPNPRSLVVKHGADGATLVEGDDVLPQRALHVDVVETVGAGDAFAAGFLAATLRGHGPRERLRAGHLQAAAVLCTVDDVGPPLTRADTCRMLTADDDTWARARVREGKVWG